MINTIIDKLSGFDNSDNAENTENKTTIYENKNQRIKPNPVDNTTTIHNPSLHQGYKFIRYQDKIKNNVEINRVNTIIRENFESGGTSSNENSKEIIDSLKKDYDSKLVDYKTTLNQYNDLSKQIQVLSTKYTDRISSENKYLNKIISFNKGQQLYYVTNQGVAKYIPDTTVLKSISEKNGCPNTSITSNYIDIGIPWIQDYLIEGTQLPTTPPLVIGKNMRSNESCGNEGSNVFVSTMLPPKTNSNYLGCYQDNSENPTMSFIRDSSGIYNLGFDQCKDAAILGGYQYFALQNADISKGLGYCAVGNDLKTAQKYGNAYAFVPLWSSNTAGKPTTYATLTKSGTLTVCAANGTPYYTSPNGTNCDQVYNQSDNTDAPGNDISYRTNVNITNCEQICTSDPNCGGFAWNKSTNSSCWIKAGRLNNTNRHNQRILKKKTVDTSKCIYFLNLQNDGNMCIYRGTPNTTNTTNIWCSNTSGRQQEANPNYSVSKSKYGMTFIKNDQVLYKGDWIVSTDGKLLLIMQNDGNLVLYTFKTNCMKGSGSNSKNYYGGNLANALYDIGSVGVKTNMGKLAYIDEDSEIHTYPTTNVAYDNTYNSVIQNTNIQGNDIPGAAMDKMSDITKCMNACNQYSECNAFVYDTTGPYPVCFPKKVSEKDLYSPSTFKPSVGKTTYIRDKKPTKLPNGGTSNNVTNIDSIRYANYIEGSNSERYGLANVIFTPKQQLSQLQSKLDNLSKNLNNIAGNLKKYNVNVDLPVTFTNTSEGFQGFQRIKNPDNYFLNSSQINNKISDLEKNSSGIDNILKDTKIKTLQQNYNYMLWSILALGAAIIAIKVKVA